MQGITRASVVGHSYGTLVASRMNKTAPAGMISRLTLIDPVCFALFLPHLVRNALYHDPVKPLQQLQQQQQDEQAAAGAASGVHGSGGPPKGVLRSLLKGLVVQEFHCAVALRRKMLWAKVRRGRGGGGSEVGAWGGWGPRCAAG